MAGETDTNNNGGNNTFNEDKKPAPDQSTHINLKLKGQICVWCWHHIMDMAEKDESEGRCPACRTAYDKDRIVGMAANCERLVQEVNMEKKHKSQKAKVKDLCLSPSMSAMNVFPLYLPSVRRVSCLTHRRIHGVGAKISCDDEDDVNLEFPTDSFLKR